MNSYAARLDVLGGAFHHSGPELEGETVIELLRIPLQNRPGQLLEVVTLISRVEVDMKALSLTNHGGDSSEVLLLVTNLSKARDALSEAGRNATAQPALVVEVSDRAGGLAAVLEAIKGAGLSINDLFTFVTRVEGKALAVITFDDIELASALLRDAGVTLIDQQTITEDARPQETGPYLLDDYLGGSFFW